MKIEDRLKNAILKGINEAFDIDDLGHRIDIAPMTKTGIEKHSKLYMELLGKAKECQNEGIKVDFINDEGESIESSEDGEDIRFIRFSCDELINDGHDNRIVISVRWKEHFVKNNHIRRPEGNSWQKERVKITDESDDIMETQEYTSIHFNGYDNTMSIISHVEDMGKDYRKYVPVVAKAWDTTEVLNGKEVHGYLPAIWQLIFISDFIDLINGIFEIIDVEPLCINQHVWWSSSEYNDNFVWYLDTDGFAKITDKAYHYHILPLFHLD